MLISFFPLFAALSVALIALRRRRAAAVGGYRLLLLLSAAPYLLHVWSAWSYIRSSSFVGPEGGTAVYPGLVAFAAVGVGSVAGVLAVDAALVPRYPLVAALTPVVLGLIYWKVALPFVQWRGPGFVMLDNTPLVWLFAWSLFATALLLLVGWLAVARHASEDRLDRLPL